MGHSDEWTFADYFKYEKEIYRAIISAAVLGLDVVLQVDPQGDTLAMFLTFVQ